MSAQCPSVAVPSDNYIGDLPIPAACGDRPLAPNEEPPLGAHLVTRRFAYAHHGVYVGAGTVVHYAAFAYHWHRGPVEEVSLSSFGHGHPVWVRPAGRNALRCEEIVRRARSRLGENHYRLLSNNCEHLSEWCVHGKHRSPQVERLLSGLRYVSRVCSAVRRCLTAAPVQHKRLSCPSSSRVLLADPPGAVRTPRPATSVAGPLFAQQGAMDGVQLRCC